MSSEVVFCECVLSVAMRDMCIWCCVCHVHCCSWCVCVFLGVGSLLWNVFVFCASHVWVRWDCGVSVVWEGVSCVHQKCALRMCLWLCVWWWCGHGLYCGGFCGVVVVC